MNQPTQVLASVWDFQDTSIFRFQGAASVLCLGQGLGDTMFCSALCFQLALLAWHTEGTSTRICLSPVETDTVQAAALAGLESGARRALWSWSRASLGRPCVPGAWRVRLSQTSCLFSWDIQPPLCKCGGFVWVFLALPV